MKINLEKWIGTAVIFLLLLIVGFSALISSPQERRVERALSRMENLSSYNVEMKATLHMDDIDRYSTFLLADFFFNRKDEEMKGYFLWELPIEGIITFVEGNFVYKEGSIYLDFYDLPLAFEPMLREDYGVNIEEMRNRWIKGDLEIDLEDIFSLSGEVSPGREEKRIDGKRVREYVVKDGKRETTLWINDLSYLSRMETEISFHLEESLSLSPPFPSLSKGSLITLKLKMDFSNFGKREDIKAPPDFLEL